MTTSSRSLGTLVLLVLCMLFTVGCDMVLVGDQAAITWQRDGNEDLVLQKTAPEHLSLNGVLELDDVIANGTSLQQLIFDVQQNGTLPPTIVGGVTYLVGPSGDFVTLADAVSHLSASTTADAVVLQLEPGSHVVSGLLSFPIAPNEVSIRGDTSSSCDYNVTCTDDVNMCFLVNVDSHVKFEGVCIHGPHSQYAIYSIFGHLQIVSVTIMTTGYGVGNEGGTLYAQNLSISGVPELGIASLLGGKTVVNDVDLQCNATHYGNFGFFVKTGGAIIGTNVAIQYFTHCIFSEVAHVTCVDTCTLSNCTAETTVIS